YDHSNNPNQISTTTLLKPIRSIVLARQHKDLDKGGDVSSLIPSRIGVALHTSIENSWLSNKAKLNLVLKSLGYTDNVIQSIRINPVESELSNDIIPVYLEKRSQKQIGKYLISGKFDFVIEGQVNDFKSTATYGYISGSNTDDYILQGSIYRWLNPTIITDDNMKIQYIFTDWSKQKAIQDKTYPQSRILEKTYALMSLVETENFLNRKINEIENLETKPQSELPLCTREQLWQTADVHKYYKNPQKLARSTKNYDVLSEARQRQFDDGGVGTIITYNGQVKRCAYCDVVGICDQANQLIKQGLLVL
ncbi:MAG: hypothetical protein ACC656_14380, partial [Candidatus Heimdallarchaeota archaeon]